MVKENLYTTDIEAMKKYNDIRKKFYNNDFPAATGYRFKDYIDPTQNWRSNWLSIFRNRKTVENHLYLLQNEAFYTHIILVSYISILQTSSASFLSQVTFL
ncbi:hypothetical protein [Chryseobacterium luquanense]|uniref:Uncharacterized protein n=1 Tax=Chryseobacterium luquanense TaxID=2983766 RepID=A0ABT3XY44_9FLAO|nr:hypothetical protein [Chryseobacterium luquanense]MCX8530764.1 hypothetical protein [Chryseobacterium luquanense]